jgi:Uma2 family endonuclease
MATKPMLSIEEYLHTSFEDGDCEFVDGEIVPKPMPPKSHSKTQKRLIEIFFQFSKTIPFHAFPELRMRSAETRCRVPDVAVYAGLEPEEEVPTLPPYIAIEILSPDDKASYLMAKLREYRAWGAAHVWVIDPLAQTLAEYGSDGLRESGVLRMPEYGLEITLADLFGAR